MPTVLRKNGYQFYFFANEGTEPSHIHVKKGGSACKWWLEPVSLAQNYGFSGHELTGIARMIREHHAMLLEAWNEFHPEQ